jgi:hypothetical protein
VAARLAQDEEPGMRGGEAGGGGGLEEMTNGTRREKSCLPLPSARGVIASSHAARENFIRIMPGVAQAIEEVLRSGHVPRAHGRLFVV